MITLRAASTKTPKAKSFRIIDRPGHGRNKPRLYITTPQYNNQIPVNFLKSLDRGTIVLFYSPLD